MTPSPDHEFFRGLFLDPEAARALDRAAIERFGIPGIVLMEHAAIGVAGIVRGLAAEHSTRRIVIACGRGGNGGDGWAVARLLHDSHDVLVLSLGEPRSDDARINAEAARRLGITIHTIAEPADLDEITSELTGAILVDALFGVGLARPISGRAMALVRKITNSGSPVVAIDLPSGLDPTHGHPLGICIRATITATMVAPKTGMGHSESRLWTGRIQCVDIGSPRILLEEFGHMARSAESGDDAPPPVRTRLTN
ncbi:MAG: NAD(P)H-hydrate epimerase [Phycisphaerae bacterium]|nr:NAD(P)H-hydrate epimerase [Phycisphaerae bacterium]